jgi:hypothetical protein
LVFFLRFFICLLLILISFLNLLVLLFSLDAHLLIRSFLFQLTTLY